MTQVSRRRITQGLAWAAPTVALAAAAPAMAASAQIPIDCSTVQIDANITGLKSWTKLVSVSTVGDEVHFDADGNDANFRVDSDQSDGANDGTFWNINVGQMGPLKPTALDKKTKITGFRIDWGTEAVVRTVNGRTGTGTVALQGTQTAMVIGAPLQQALGVRTTIPYKGVAPDAGNTLKSISLPFSVTFLDGLTAAARSSNACGGWYVNFCYTAAPGPLGNYGVSSGVADSGNAYTITRSPQDPCA